MIGMVNRSCMLRKGRREAWCPALLLVLLSQTTSACQAAESRQEPVAVEVVKVGFDRSSNLPVVILRDKGEERAIPIWIGPFEARAIDMELQGEASPRPLTHDLLKSILQGAGVVFEKVLVNDLKDGTYYAQIYLTSAGKDFQVDSRPSDAIALALRFRKPILVARSLMDGDTALDLQASKKSSVERVRGITVQEITDVLAASLGLSDTEGLLVSDVTGSENAVLKRGDIILEVGGQPVRDLGDFRSILTDLEGKGIKVRLLRGGKEQVVDLLP